MTKISVTCDNCGKRIIDTISSNADMDNSLSQYTHEVTMETTDNKNSLGISNILVEYNPPRSRSLKARYVNFCCAECFITWYKKKTI